MDQLHLKGLIEIYNGNPYINITPDQITNLKPGWKKPMPVLVQINGQPIPPWKINMMPIGDGAFYLYLHGDVRKASNTKVGDIVTVDLKFDSNYKNGPQHPMPKWFATALDKNPTAKQNWQKLIPSRQKEILRYFSWLKSQAAIDRNLTLALQALSGDETLFMARTWKDGG